MPKNKDPTLENLINGTEELIRDIPLAGALSAASLPASQLDDDLRRREVEALSSESEPTNDGVAGFTVSSDHMLVLATFYPPTGDGKPLDLEAVRVGIEALGVTTGVDWETVKRSVLNCNEERLQLSDVEVAHGKKPEDEILPYLVMNPDLKPKALADDPPTRVDFWEVSPFTIVKKGDALASIIPKHDGAMGKSVMGADVPFLKHAVPFPKPGKNTLWQKGSVHAACDGKFQLTSTGFWIEEVLDIHGDIDFHVGNIDFPGNVMIQGEVRNGFVVKSGGSLLCLGSIEACQIDCTGDFVTRKGIVGGNKAMLRVGGTMHAKFIEGCSIDSKGSIYVSTSVLNSSVHTGDRLEMGNRSLIVGGTIQAQNGISAFQIGTARGPRTEIYCGIDFGVERKLVWCRDKNIALAFKLKDVENKMKASPEAKSLLSALRDKIKAAIHQVNENAMLLITNLDRNEGADVSVREVVYPGTYIEICHISFVVTKAKRFVTFHLDKASGKIVEKKWEKQTVRPQPRP